MQHSAVSHFLQVEFWPGPESLPVMPINRQNPVGL
jgi:hypothetical protein